MLIMKVFCADTDDSYVDDIGGDVRIDGDYYDYKDDDRDDGGDDRDDGNGFNGGDDKL